MNLEVGARCENCGALYDAIGSGRCNAPTDGGGTCRGRIVLLTHGQAQGVLSQAPGLPDALSGILSRAEMRRGALLNNGQAVAVMVFDNAEDRAQFASAVLTAGGKVMPG